MFIHEKHKTEKSRGEAKKQGKAEKQRIREAGNQKSKKYAARRETFI